MATTTNYGWTTPDDTALVKDGASAIRSLGTSVDTTTKNLNPSTTLGDIEYRSSTANTNTRLGIGSTGQVLTVASGVPSWATPAGGGGWTSLASGSLSGTSTSVNITTTGYKQVIVFVKNVSCTTDYYQAFDLNTDTGSNYSFVNQYSSSTTAVSAGARDATTSFFVDDGFKSTENSYATWIINDPANTTAHKTVSGIATGRRSSNNYNLTGQFFGRYMSNSAITNIRFQPASTYSTGTYEIYGVK